MRTIYQTKMNVNIAADLAHDFPEMFQSDGTDTLEITDLGEAFTLSGAVELFEDETSLYLIVDGTTYYFFEA